jgi:hypothetical protein|tara:strand:+ start:989 stop:1915 length:927 start_codon:yes stop_codon:yes gene_type:complete
MKTLYLAKEPDLAVRDDLSKISGEVVVVDCLNAYDEWYKKKGYNCITRDEFFNLKDMRFDVSIGNPPFQEGNHKAKTSSLWKKFLEKSDEISDKVILVIPASFASPTKLFSLYKNNLSLIDLTVGEHFKGVGSSFCRIVLEKEKQETCKVVTTGGTYHLNLSDWDCIPKNLDNDIMTLIDKFFTNQSGKWKVSYEYDQRKPYIKDKGSIEILHSTKRLYTDKDHPNNHLIRVFCTITNGTKFDVVTPGTGLSQNNIWTTCDSLEEANKLRDSLNHPDVQKLLKVFQFSNMNYFQIINKLDLNEVLLSC